MSVAFASSIDHFLFLNNTLDPCQSPLCTFGRSTASSDEADGLHVDAYGTECGECSAINREPEYTLSPSPMLRLYEVINPR